MSIASPAGDARNHFEYPPTEETMKTQLRTIAAVGALCGAVACSNTNAGRATLSLTSRRAPAAALAPSPSGSAASILAAGDTTVITLGSDTIILRSVDIVLREIELKKVETAACDSAAATGDCEEFEVGTTLVSVPLGAASAAALVAVNAPAGMYNGLEFKIHRPGSDDAGFIAQHPDFNGVSIRVTGTYSKAGTRTAFTLTSVSDASQEMAL